MAEAPGQSEIRLTIICGVDKQGRLYYDWEAEATVPKGYDTPRVDQWMAQNILEGAMKSMAVKDTLNWKVSETAPKEPDGTTESPSDRLP